MPRCPLSRCKIHTRLGTRRLTGKGQAVDLLTFGREQIPWLLLLVLPGFISIRVFELLVPARSTSTGREALEALSYGAVNFGIWLAPLLYGFDWLRARPIRFGLVMFAVLVVSPALLAIGARILLAWSVVARWVRSPVPTAWDHFFGLRRAAWMRLRLKSGQVVGGFYGDRSFASSDTAGRDLYLELAWRLDPQDLSFVEPAERSLGVLVSRDELEYIELFSPAEATTDGHGSQT